MPSQTYKAAQRFLLDNLADPRVAAEQFRWPELDRFNWALDWFDAELAARARIGTLIVPAAETEKFADVDPEIRRICTGDPPAGWLSFRHSA
jgi:acetyl-CoA synthetase